MGWDAGLAWSSPGGQLSAKATAYRLTVRDEIDYAYPQGYLNIARARTTGAEVEGEARLGHGLSLKANYAYADAKDLSTGARLLRVPTHSASAELTWTGGKADAALVVRGQGKAADVYGEIRPFTVADLTGSYAVTRHVRLTARIENLTDARYQQAFGYGEPGFGLFVGVRLSE